MENRLKYAKLMEEKPTIYETFTNSLGQVFDLVEHPFDGDEYPVIIVHHESKTAVNSGFYDTEDFYLGSDYEPVLHDGKIMCMFEKNL